MRLFLITLNFIVCSFKLLKLYLNKKQRDKGLPEELKSLYNRFQYDKWMKYENITDQFAIKKIVIHFILDSIIIVSPLYSFLHSIFHRNILINSLCMFVFIYMITAIFTFIEDYYRIFKIEDKFGMNNMNFKTFFIDEVKESVFDLILFIVLLLLVHYLYSWFSYYGLIAVFVIIAFLIYILQKNSLMLLKFYNKFTPIEEGKLKDKLIRMVEEQGFILKGIYVMDASKRTKRANAFCTGDKEKVICIDDNMFKYYSTDEILAVFAHELGHAVYNHSDGLKKINYLRMILMMILFIIVLSDPGLYYDFGVYNLNYFMVMFLFGGFVEPMMLLLSIVQNIESRKSEFEADSFAAKKGYGDELKSILMKLSKNDLADVMPHPLVVKLTYSHPPLLQRISNLDKRDQL